MHSLFLKKPHVNCYKTIVIWLPNFKLHLCRFDSMSHVTLLANDAYLQKKDIIREVTSYIISVNHFYMYLYPGTMRLLL